jgi:hypothetical protein
MKRFFYLLTTAFILCLLLFDGFSSRSGAVYEGTANANMMIRRHERRQQFGKASLWREAAAECLDAISIPLAKIMVEYCQRRGNVECVMEMQAEIADTKMQIDEHLRRAKENWKKAKKDEKGLDAERANIDKFIAEWVPHYPDRFYEFGIYRNVFRERIDELRELGKFGDALILEAEASDMCARQYEDVTVKYFTNKAKVAEAEAYQKLRDEHLKRSAMLRALAKEDPETWPAEADKRDFSPPKAKYKLSADKAIKLARSDKRIKQVLEGKRNFREFAWFQGFCWTVAYYSQDWGSLAIAFVDDEAGKITDVLISPGDLEEREREEAEERERELRLSPERVIQIVRGNSAVKKYFTEHPNAKTEAAYNWRYNCWIVEVILNNREVGMVSVSDGTEEVLEISLGDE